MCLIIRFMITYVIKRLLDEFRNFKCCYLVVHVLMPSIVTDLVTQVLLLPVLSIDGQSHCLLVLI